MNWTLVWQAFGIFVAGTLLLRIAGRKSIAEMTLAQAVLMIGLGSLLIQPLTGYGYWVTIGVGGVLVLSMIVLEYLEAKVDGMENLITGKAVVVIQNGQLQEKNLRKLRLTVDKLEMRLRQAGIGRIEDVEWATLEVSGVLGYQLKPDKQPATKADIEMLLKMIEERLPAPASLPSSRGKLFMEINQGHSSPPPKQYQ